MPLTREQRLLLTSLVLDLERSERAAKAAEKAATEDRRKLVLFYSIVVNYAPENLRLGPWFCDAHPCRPRCVYYDLEDPDHKFCLFCGQPEERL